MNDMVLVMASSLITARVSPHTAYKYTISKLFRKKNETGGAREKSGRGR